MGSSFIRAELQALKNVRSNLLRSCYAARKHWIDPYKFKNTTDPPIIKFNFLSTEIDIDVTLKAIRIARSIMTAPVMEPLQITEAHRVPIK